MVDRPTTAADGGAGGAAAMLSHETRTPLNAIKGFAELLLAGGCGPLGAEAQACVAGIAGAARDLEAAVAAASSSGVAAASAGENSGGARKSPAVHQAGTGSRPSAATSPR